jgi:hypothetical protein
MLNAGQSGPALNGMKGERPMKRATFVLFLLIFSAAAVSVFSVMAPQGQSPEMRPLLGSNPTLINISLSATDSDTPLVGVDANGAAYVVWFEYQNSRSFYFATNKSGQWSSPQYFEQIVYNVEEAGYPWLDVSASGVCHLSFQDGRDFVSYDIYHSVYQNNSWSALTNVSNNDGGSCYSGCAVNPVDNSTYIVWQDGTGLGWGWNLLLRYRSSSGSWSPTQLFPHSGGYMPQIAIDGKGTAHLIWTTGWGSTLWYSKNQTPQNVSSWTQPVLIKGDVGEDWSFAKVACDNAGNAYIIWMDGTAGNDEIFLRIVNSNGTLAPEVNVSQSAVSSQEGALAVNKNSGDILVAWKENDDIFANARIGASWTGPGNVSQSAALSKMPSVAIDNSGRAHLVYAEMVGGNWEIMYMTASPSQGLPIFDGHDFNGNGASEVSVFRPSQGKWYISGSPETPWGISGDIPANGDYDGNGITDIAVWRPSNGYWFIKDQFIAQWGAIGDIPVPGKYDSDGKTDIAVWRPSNGCWYIQYSGGGVAVIQWGTSGDIPVPKDYDGDGKTDIAVFRPSNGVWYIQYSGGGVGMEQWGTSGDIPVPGKYDTDLKADIAVWRPGNGNWYIKYSAGGTAMVQFGASDDIPTPGDYNGNGQTEIAVWRPGNGCWYVKDNQIIQWGTVGDIPVVR